MVHSQERHNLNKNNTSQLLSSVQEQKEAEGIKLELTEFPVSVFRSGQKSWAAARVGKSGMICGISQETCPAASQGASRGLSLPLQMSSTSCLPVPAHVIYQSPWYAG